MTPAELSAILLCLAQPLATVCAPQQAPTQSDAKSQPSFVQTVAHAAAIERDAAMHDGERLMVDVAVGSIDCRVDEKATETRIAADFTVDGQDAADAERRAKLVKLYAERASDGTIIVNSIFPGKRLPYDAVRLTIVSPPTEEVVLKSTSGTVRAHGTTGVMRASTKSGVISIESHKGSLDARSTDGRVEIKGALEGVYATSTSGAIVVALADGNDHPFKVETRTGSARVEVGPSFDGVVHMATTGGSIAVVDPAKRVRVSEQSDTRLVAEIGAAAGQSEVKASSGALTLAVREK